jgi:alpha-D-xyloside xylohydrolase
MLDLGELTPEDARYFNGLDGRAMHNRYPVLYAQAAFESATSLKPDSVLFNRAGGIGAQAFQHLQWPGDPLIDWSESNGFKSMLPAALSFGLSGFPYWHPEVGGYLATGLPRDSERELWFRWLQLGAFSSLLRDQYGDHQTGSPPVEMWSDEETIEAFRFYARLHNRLLPYLYSYARIASETGLPLMRHLALNYPEDARAWTEERQYTLGDELLVAPVLEEAARTRMVYLPAGQWVDFWTGAIFEGAREIVAEAPLDRIPVYARAGALLPMAADFETLVSTVEPGVRTWTGGLVIRAMPSNGPASSTFALYDGTRMSYRTDGARSDLRLKGSPGSRDLEIRLPVASTPSQVLVDGHASPNWRYETGSAEVVVSLHMGDLTLSVYY